jgi:hypothetical protein
MTSKATSAAVAQVLIAAAQGSGKAECAKAAGISRQTLETWLRSSRAGTFAIPAFHEMFEAQRARHREEQVRTLTARFLTPNRHGSRVVARG